MTLKEKEPVNTIPFYMDLLAISLKTEEFDKAEEYLKLLREKDKEFDFTTHFAEAHILVAKGEIEKALALLNKVKKTRPSAEIFFQIGKLHRRNSQFEKAKENLKTKKTEHASTDVAD